MDDQSICVVTHPLGTAGENATRTLLNILSAITTVSLITANLPADSNIRASHEVVEFARRDPGRNVVYAAGSFIINQIRITKIIRSRDESIVLFYGATSYVLPILSAKLLGRTVIIEPRGDVPLTLQLEWERRFPARLAVGLANILRALEWISYTIADAIISYTPSMADELGLLGFDDKVYTNGARYVDVERFRPEIPYTERGPVAGYVGRLDEEKGIRTLARAAKHLSTGTFRFVGDGDLKPWLETVLAEEIAEGSVELTGWVDHEEVPEELNRLKILVLPSQPTEGLPTTILEAFACGTPVYATPVSGVPDVVREGETGFLMTDPGEKELATKIEYILGRDDLSELSDNCRALIESTYDFDAAIERYRRILEDLKTRDEE